MPNSGTECQNMLCVDNLVCLELKKTVFIYKTTKMYFFKWAFVYFLTVQLANAEFKMLLR